jgi:Fur family ferric uptake transcriptional regulator
VKIESSNSLISLLSPGEVLDAARDAVNAMGFAMVYGTLELLVAEGAVQAITLRGKSSRHEMAESAHHLDLRCNMHRHAFEVPGCPGNLRRLAPRAFTVEHHEITLYGRCSDGAKRKNRASR